MMLGCGDVAAEMRRTRRLNDAQVRFFIDKGVPADALHPIGVDKVVFHRSGGFEFERYLDCQEPDNPQRAIAVILTALSVNGDPIDLAAWEPATDRVGCWRNASPVLGEENLFAPRLNDHGALVVHRSPLGYLQSGRRGIVILMTRGKVAARRLLDHGPFEGEDAHHAFEIKKLLVMPLPVVYAPADVIRQPADRYRALMEDEFQAMDREAGQAARASARIPPHAGPPPRPPERPPRPLANGEVPPPSPPP